VARRQSARDERITITEVPTVPHGAKTTQTVPDLRGNAMNESVQPATVPITNVLCRQDNTHVTSARVDAPNIPLPTVDSTTDECFEAPDLAPWSSIIQSLTGDIHRPDMPSHAPVDRRRLKRAARQNGHEGFSHAACVAVLERTSASSALVSWRDPTRCSYGFQMWHRSVSRRSGICALSGSEIHRGDSVYQPRTRPRPLNASAMILAAHIESACPS
jgi:Domain of unknown function (DUF3331)